MVKFNFVAFLIFELLTLPSISQSRWKAVTYSVTFTIKHVAGVTAKGKFTGLKADILFDPKNTGSAIINATLEASTFQTGNNLRDKTVKGKEYLDVISYPLISMRSIKVMHKEGDNYEGVFRLTIKSVTKDIPIKFSFTRSEKQGVFKSEFTVNRLDYGIGSKSFMLSNEAVITILVNTVKE